MSIFARSVESVRWTATSGRRSADENAPGGRVPPPAHSSCRSSSPLARRGPVRRRPREGGFALLITLTLLAFLVILLVGLATYTRVETAVASNTQRQSQARHNALLALNLALGQLQKTAGPDQRVTATADAFGGLIGTKHYTGVWSTAPAAAGLTPLTWLVSGNEVFKIPGDITSNDPLAITPATPGSSTIELVGKNTSGTASDVLAPLIDLKSFGVPGNLANDTTAIGGTITGRYAWWVGDQGVKAPVALGDPTATAANFDYSPYKDFPDLLSRIRQQISLGAGAADATGTTVFEPRDTNNAALVANNNVTADSQLAFLKNASNTSLGLTVAQQNFHNWSPNNFNVLANTRLGGLRQDLSLFSPSTTASPLGPAYDAWADYKSYMEDPANPVAPIPVQPYSADPLRRRYVMQPASAAYGISPVLSFFGLSFSLHNDTTGNSPTQLIASIRCVAELWNPYTSALVPEDLAIVVRGLPTVAVESFPSITTTTVDLQSVFQTADGTVKFALPFTSDGENADRSSWLPGRVYDWSALSSTGDPGSAGYTTKFYVRDATPGSGSGVERNAGAPIGPNTISGVQQRRHCKVTSKQTLTIELRRASTSEVLATFTSPTFDAFDSDNGLSSLTVGGASSDFAYVFRLPDRQEIPTGENDPWLQSAGRDVRETQFPTAGHAGYLVANGKDFNPVNAVTSGTSGFPASHSPELLLNRNTDAASENYNEDAPVFELPRAPLLSLGMLQHLRISGFRPFLIGNSWTTGAQLSSIKVDELFDRFYFSGLASGVSPTVVNGSLLLPNPLLKVLRNSSTGVATTEADLRAAPNAQSAKFLLQGGAFNLNSVSPSAWAAVLRSVRYSAAFDFKYLDASATTGTAGDDATAAAGLTDAAFVRFPQSAQEVYKADDSYQRTGAISAIDTPFFRRGVRTLAATDVKALAEAIVTLIDQHHAASGPFRHLEEFLNTAAPGNPSLLEQAIVNANLNANVAEFSSQWLTQGDIMTALAPVLFPRSDTFVIRAYGEAVNPATGFTEGKAWCEATVQRVPDYFDSSAATGDAAEVAPAAPINQALGRRFKIISFRWLTRSDI